MSGLLLFGVLGIWLIIVVWIALKLTKSIKQNWLRIVVFCATVVLLFPLIVADELITAPQFAKLCEEGAKLKFDPERIRGKTIFLAQGPSPKPRFTVGFLEGYYIPWRYHDATTKEELISENIYVIKGGAFIRALGISETTAPLLMPSSCGSPEHPTQKIFLDRYNMKFIEQKDIK